MSDDRTTIRISRRDAPTAMVDDETWAALSPRLGGLPMRGGDGSLMVVIEAPPDEAVRAVEQAMDSTPALADEWRDRYVIEVRAG
jgi:hypothetical protein